MKRQYDEYRKECMLVVGAMVAGLREYLEAPDGYVSLYCKHGSWAGRKVDSPLAAMHLADDTFWHFGISMDLFEESGQLPFHTIGFDIKLKKVGPQIHRAMRRGTGVRTDPRRSPTAFARCTTTCINSPRSATRSRFPTSFSKATQRGDLGFELARCRR